MQESRGFKKQGREAGRGGRITRKMREEVEETEADIT